MSNTTKQMYEELESLTENSPQKIIEELANSMLSITDTLDNEGLKVVPDKVYKIMALKLIKKDRKQYKFIRDSLKNDKDILEVANKNNQPLLKMIKENNNIFKYLDQNIRADKELVLEVLAIDGLLLEFVDEKLRSDSEIIEVAIKQNKDAEKFIIKDTMKEIEEHLKFKGFAFSEENKGDKYLIKVYKNNDIIVSVIKNVKGCHFTMKVTTN